MKEVPLLSLLQVVHDRAGGTDGQREVFESEALERLRLEVLNEDVAPVVLAEDPVVERRRKAAERAAEEVSDRVAVAPLQDQLGRLESADLFGELVQRELARLELAGGCVDVCEPHGLAGRRDGGGEDDGGEEIVLFLVQDAVGERHAGRDDLDDVALHDAFREPGVFELLADGDPVPGLQELRKVGFKGMMRKARQRDLSRGAVSAPGERDSQDAGGRDGVLLERLEEIPHPEQQDGVRIARFDLRVLLHQGGGHGRKVTEMRLENNEC